MTEPRMNANRRGLDFKELVEAIRAIHKELATQTKRAVNLSITLRNWLIGLRIQEYELHGADRAVYGDSLFDTLAAELSDVSNCNRRQLYRYLRFYRLYPQIVGTLPPQLEKLLPTKCNVPEKVGTPSPQFHLEADKLIRALSYSHLERIVDVDDDTKRAFYEIECIRGNWSVRELKRQINSLYYERSSLSTDKTKLAELSHADAEQSTQTLAIRDPYVFEFLGLKSRDVMNESDLEDELLDKLQEFLLELGHGFCFEARQKRILIGDKHNFVDLVFYHRILKCHVLVELKLEEFSHENVGQLNTYVSWYRKNMVTEGDNPPVGILLCTDKDHALMEYALAGMDNNLFVSKYLLELPKKEEMQHFLEAKLKEAGNND